MAGDDRLKLSPNVVTRVESGDRAVEPLYPSWYWMESAVFDMATSGPWDVLKEPHYSHLVAALEEVRRTAAHKPLLARALMQADLWAAYDLFHKLRVTGADRAFASESVERRGQCDVLLRLLAGTVRALALDRAQIAGLPDTYADRSTVGAGAS